MFIVSKRNYRVRRADGSSYFIKRDYIGEIPEDVAASSLVQRAIRGGMICVPEGTRDQQLEEADREAGDREAENDIRPDAAEAEDLEAEDPKPPAGKRGPGKKER